MSELLVEFFSEEIPARMQARAEADLARLAAAGLEKAGLAYGRVETTSGPRRLALYVYGLAAHTPDLKEERKGPRVDAPEKAIAGFLRSVGLESLEQCETREDKRGGYYVARIEQPGRPAQAVIAALIPDIAHAFPWPKSMRFGEGERAQRWVRPLQRLVCLLNGNIVPVRLFGLEACGETEGHRLHGRGPFAVRDIADYERTLRERGFVIARRDDRLATIRDEARALCRAQGLELVEDEGLLQEVAGLVELPVPLMGEMDPAFLDLPPEIIALTMKTHQKYFAVRDPQSGDLAPRFIVTANQNAPDGGAAIAKGAARVLSARLSDARHFWQADRKKGLEAMAEALSGVVFHDRLGTIAEKVVRIAALARAIAPAVGADPDQVERAARLCKADLVSQSVYEFPELQGLLGRYLAQDAGENPEIAEAIAGHYRPQGPSDSVPSEPVSIALALADKLDTLLAFWVIDEKPTGSGDPFALRRAGLGVLRILLENDVRVDLAQVDTLAAKDIPGGPGVGETTSGLLLDHLMVEVTDFHGVGGLPLDELSERAPRVIADLFAFLADRLKVLLRGEGLGHDRLDAVFALGDSDFVRVTARARALQRFLDTDDGAALLAGYKRAANILKAEEKKDGRAYDGDPDPGYASDPPEAAERALLSALAETQAAAQNALETEDFEAAMAALSALRAPVDLLFETVTINAADAALRVNRLLLLSRIRAGVRALADFDKLEG